MAFLAADHVAVALNGVGVARWGRDFLGRVVRLFWLLVLVTTARSVALVVVDGEFVDFVSCSVDVARRLKHETIKLA